MKAKSRVRALGNRGSPVINARFGVSTRPALSQRGTHLQHSYRTGPIRDKKAAELLWMVPRSEKIYLTVLAALSSNTLFKGIKQAAEKRAYQYSSKIMRFRDRLEEAIEVLRGESRGMRKWREVRGLRYKKIAQRKHTSSKAVRDAYAQALEKLIETLHKNLGK